MATHPSEVDLDPGEPIEQTPPAPEMRLWRTLREEIEIESSPAAVWEVLRAFGDVAKWAPGIAWSHCLEGGTDGIGARRLMRHRWGFRLEEVVTAWEEGRGFTFLVKRAPFPLNFVLETWTVAESRGHARVETTVEYNTHVGVIGRLIDRVLVHHLIRREMRRGLAGLKSCLAHSQQSQAAASKAPYPLR